MISEVTWIREQRFDSLGILSGIQINNTAIVDALILSLSHGLILP
jgi:hypothetical protein